MAFLGQQTSHVTAHQQQLWSLAKTAPVQTKLVNRIIKPQRAVITASSLAANTKTQKLAPEETVLKRKK